MIASDVFEFRSNPFSTRSTRPASSSYRFHPGESLAGLVRQLADHGWRGQITGPHGSGKSTLLASLLPVLEAAGRIASPICLRDRQRSLPRTWETVPCEGESAGHRRV